MIDAGPIHGHTFRQHTLLSSSKQKATKLRMHRTTERVKGTVIELNVKN